MDEPRRSELLLKVCKFIPIYNQINVFESDGKFVCKNLSTGEEMVFPTSPRFWELVHMEEGYVNYMGAKYTSNSVSIEQGDTVVDIGAFVGAFSLYASKKASKVLAVEPSENNFECLVNNTDHISNISTHKCAITNDPSKVELNLSGDPTDHSLIEVDSENTGNKEIVQAITVKEFCRNLCINEVDFLKIDAEGLEPEVIESINDTPVHKIAVDCSAERRGNTTIEEVVRILNNSGYDCNSGKVVFAKK